MFPEVGYRLAWDKLTADLSGLPIVCPSTKALRDLRRGLGSAPVRALFEMLAGPTTPGVRFGPYRTVSFDGCSSIKVPDSERNRGWLGRCPHGGYPQVELMTLVETGTRAVIGSVFGPTREDETSYATRLSHHLHPEMLVLWDRGFDSNDFLAAVHACACRECHPPWSEACVWTGGRRPRRSSRCSGVVAGSRVMMIDRAAATGLPGRDQRVRAAASAADERPGQGCGDPVSPPSDHGARTPTRQCSSTVQPERPGVPGGTTAPTAVARFAASATARTS
ncbi:transposase domain-containing protein [Streptomyces sp. WAC05858]|uniref:transposase domain-containing protein n=1 Tax=Streptomyces TaxID=1883 RepID=UPI000F780F3E|nr:hypothetical protein EF902_41595 [Streptomyces sp. WAC05858]